MAIDIRADVDCSLGPVIAGNIGDDYIQGSGLIKTTGTVTINDLITPDIGTIVTFSYTKSGITRSIPRTLRVKSSFADPFRRTTQVELGCKLDYLSDLKDRLTWDAFNDPENDALTEEDAKVITIPIRASSVMNECLTQFGITASSNPLTNKFSIAEFDFSAGYFSVLSDLLVSESYCGHLDANEVLQVFSLNQGAGTGSVITSNDIIDLSPIGVGNLPGEAVTVSYSTLRLKPPEPAPGAGSTPEEEEEYDNNIARINWERSEVQESAKQYYIPIRENDPDAVSYKVYGGANNTVTETEYRLINVYNDDGKIEAKEVPVRKKITANGPSIEKLGACASAYLNEGEGDFNNAYIILSETEETYDYDSSGREIKKETSVSEPEACILGSSQFDWVYGGVNFVASYNLMASAYTLETKEYSANMEQQTIVRYKKWAQTQAGVQAISVSNELVQYATVQEALVPANAILGGGLAFDSATQQINTSGATPERPSAADRTNAAQSKDGGGGGEYGTENDSELELALGSAEAQRRIELSMPYAPDDTFYVSGVGSYGVIASDAASKANLYGRVQNNLLLGNRSGISLQLAPEKLPTKPFDPIYLEANGLTAQYRVNAANWAFDSSGIICSTDALFWGAVGGTGVFWFPVAPGIVTLPSAPSVVDTSPTEVIGTIATVGATPQTTLDAAFPDAVAGDGVQDVASGDFWVYDASVWTDVGPTPGPTTTPTTLVPTYNETIVYNSRVRATSVVSKFDYSLELFTEIPPSIVKLRLSIAKVLPSASIGLVPQVPLVLTDVGIEVPSGSIDFRARTPYAQKLGLPVPAGNLQLSGRTPYVNNLGIPIPTVQFALAAQAPTLLTTVNVNSITYTQSTAYPGTTLASNAIMTDGSFTNTGAGTESTESVPGSWIRMDLGGSTRVGSIVVGTATNNIPGGWDRSYTENKDIQYSVDNSSWTTVTNTGTFATNGIYTFTVDITARYIRIANTSLDGLEVYVGISEFYALAPGQSYP